MPIFADLNLYYAGSSHYPPRYNLFSPVPRLSPSPLTAPRPSKYSPLLPTISESFPISPIIQRRPLPLPRVNSPRRLPPPTSYLPPRPIRIDTADIDVSTPRRINRKSPQTNNIHRGRTIVRLHTHRLEKKKSPGERLVEKFLIRDKNVKVCEKPEPVELPPQVIQHIIDNEPKPALTEADVLDCILKQEEEEISNSRRNSDASVVDVPLTKLLTLNKRKTKKSRSNSRDLDEVINLLEPVEKCQLQRRNTVKIRRMSQDLLSPEERADESKENIPFATNQRTIKKKKKRKVISVEVSVDNHGEKPPLKFVIDEVSVEETAVSTPKTAKKLHYEVVVETQPHLTQENEVKDCNMKKSCETFQNVLASREQPQINKQETSETNKEKTTTELKACSSKITDKIRKEGITRKDLGEKKDLKTEVKVPKLDKIAATSKWVENVNKTNCLPKNMKIATTNSNQPNSESNKGVSSKIFTVQKDKILPQKDKKIEDDSDDSLAESIDFWAVIGKSSSFTSFVQTEKLFTHTIDKEKVQKSTALKENEKHPVKTQIRPKVEQGVLGKAVIPKAEVADIKKKVEALSIVTSTIKTGSSETDKNTRLEKGSCEHFANTLLKKSADSANIPITVENKFPAVLNKTVSSTVIQSTKLVDPANTDEAQNKVEFIKTLPILNTGENCVKLEKENKLNIKSNKIDNTDTKEIHISKSEDCFELSQSGTVKKRLHKTDIDSVEKSKKLLDTKLITKRDNNNQFQTNKPDEFVSKIPSPENDSPNLSDSGRNKTERSPKYGNMELCKNVPEVNRALKSVPDKISHEKYEISHKTTDNNNFANLNEPENKIEDIKKTFLTEHVSHNNENKLQSNTQDADKKDESKTEETTENSSVIKTNTDNLKGKYIIGSPILGGSKTSQIKTNINNKPLSNNKGNNIDTDKIKLSSNMNVTKKNQDESSKFPVLKKVIADDIRKEKKIENITKMPAEKTKLMKTVQPSLDVLQESKQGNMEKITFKNVGESINETPYKKKEIDTNTLKTQVSKEDTFIVPGTVTTSEQKSESEKKGSKLPSTITKSFETLDKKNIPSSTPKKLCPGAKVPMAKNKNQINSGTTKVPENKTPFLNDSSKITSPLTQKSLSDLPITTDKHENESLNEIENKRVENININDVIDSVKEEGNNELSKSPSIALKQHSSDSGVAVSLSSDSEEDDSSTDVEDSSSEEDSEEESSTSTSSSDERSTVPLLASNPALDPNEELINTPCHHRSGGRVTPPATSLPRFRKYTVDDFQFLKVLGKGSFGKVLLAELRNTEYYYAVKCLKKDVVLEDDDVECTLIERKVLALGTKHPYLCHLFCTFQTESHLFFVMEYLNGGDLMFHIQQSGRFPEPRARFYAAEIVSGLRFLHSKGIVYRDLKLDNVLLDFDGHVRIADFGMCKLQIFLDRTADTFCGTPDYMAPEIIKGAKYNQCVDWWSFGVLLYEMLVGQSPFSGCDEDDLFWCICNEEPKLPRYLSQEATNILTLLLEKDSSKRLGTRECGAGDIKHQPFFHNIDWDALERRDLEPPFKPRLQHPLDVQYFDKAFTAERAKLTPVDRTILQSMDQTQFQGFSYTNPNATD